MATPETNEVAAPSRYDSIPTNQSKNLSLLKISTILNEQASGEISRAMDLFSEAIQKDGVIASCLQTRSEAVSSSEWRVVPGGETPKDIAAAEFATEVLDGIPDFQEDLEQASGFISHGLSVFEIMWKREGSNFIVEDLIWRNQNRFKWNPDDPYELLFVPSFNVSGVALPPNKFLQFIPRGHQGYPATGGLMRLLMWYYILSNYGLKGWGRALEKFGIPAMLGTYDDATKKDELKKNIARMAADMFGVMEEGTTLELLERKITGEWPFLSQLEYLDNIKRMVILGHTGSNVSTSGQLGGEVAAEAVRLDIKESDARVYEQVVTFQLLKPLTEINFGLGVATPQFELITAPALDMDKEATRDKMLVVDMGVETSARQMREKYNLPEPDGEDDILRPPASGSAALFSNGLNPAPFLFSNATRDQEGNEDDRQTEDFFDGVKKKHIKRLTGTPSP